MIFITKEKEFEKNEFAVMAILNLLINTRLDLLCITVKEICYYLTGKILGNTTAERNMKKAVKESFESLIRKQYLDCEIVDNHYLIQSRSAQVNTEKETFIYMEVNDIFKIFKYGHSPFDVFWFYCQLLSKINNNSKTYMLSIDWIAEHWHMSKTTICKYFGILEELHLIYVHRYKGHPIDSYHNVPNVFGRYKDKANVIEEANDYWDSMGAVLYYEKLDRRSIKQKYNAFMSGSKKYEDPDQRYALYMKCLEYNNSLKYLKEMGKDVRELDLSVFDTNNPDSPCFDILKDWESLFETEYVTGDEI